MLSKDPLVNSRSRKIILLFIFSFKLLIFLNGFFWVSLKKDVSFAQSIYQYDFLEDWKPSFKNFIFFNSLSDVALDPDGHLYVADRVGHNVQKFTSDGVLVRKWGKEGDDEGEFLWPSGIAVDQKGHVFVADNGNYRIQKFTSHGKYITEWPVEEGATSLTVDQEGNVYVIDRDYRIQKFSSNGVYINSWAVDEDENGDTFLLLTGISSDNENNVYVSYSLYVFSGTDKHRILKFTSNGNLISEWECVGDNEEEIFWPKDVAVDSAGNVYSVGSVFVDNHIVDERIKKFTSAGEYITSWGSRGEDKGELDSPSGLAVDPHGYVYVADTGNNRIQKFISDGNFDAEWGEEYPSDPATYYFDQFGRLDYAVSRFNALLEKHVYDGASLVQIKTYPDNDIYYYTLLGVWSDTGDTINFSLPPGGKLITSYTGGRPSRIDWYPDLENDDYYYTIAIYRYDGVKRHRLILYCPEEFDCAGAEEKHEPTTIALTFDESEYAYVAVQDLDSRSIQKLDPDGGLVAEWSEGEQDSQYSFWGIQAVAADHAGHVYVADSFYVANVDQFGNKGQKYPRSRIQKFDLNGDLVAAWEVAGRISSPAAVSADSEGYVYRAVDYADRILKYDSEGEVIAEWGSEGNAAGEFLEPRGIAVSQEGYVYVVDTGNNRVQKFTADGEFLLMWGEEGDAAGKFSEPWGIKVDQDGYVYVVDTGNYRIQKFSPEGDFVTAFGRKGDGEGEFLSPKDVVVNESGQVHVLDAENTRIQTFEQVLMQGRLKVDIEPEEARWRRINTADWLESGHKDLSPGEYALEFSIVPGWEAMNPKTVKIEPDQITELKVNYEENANNYSIDVSVADTGGMITGSGTYLHNTQVTLTATPDQGYRFLYWTINGQIVSTDQEYTFLVTENMEILAHFEQLSSGLPGVMMLLLDDEE